MQSNQDSQLADWRTRALAFEQTIKNAVIGQDSVLRLITVAVFSRGHVMLEGDVGVGKTTLLRAVSRAIGGAYERIEGTIDLMPNDLIYHTYINQQGKPQVDPGPILRHEDMLSTFFFNEVNRARPQVHSLLLRIMAERSISAFNRDYWFPHLQVFADRNRVEKEETFEIPSAARDRFLMELNVPTPEERQVQSDLMFHPRFHDVEALLETVTANVLPYQQLNEVGKMIQDQIGSTETLQAYALDLWQATRTPEKFGIKLEGIDTAQLILAGASARGMSMMMRAARVNAWINDRSMVLPEDIQAVFYETVAHRIFFNPMYELRRESLIQA
ncbi:MAG: MoxR family ATPase, partial [Methylococcales bacterium]|nr:MoxR family ATPase [Methylococcales bacterium]